MSSMTLRVLLGGLALFAAMAFIGCKGNGSTTSEGSLSIPPFFEARWGFSTDANGNTTYTVDAGAAGAGKCGKITWSGADGAELGSDIIELDGSGGASGQVPPGAVRWQIAVVDCPPKPKGASPMAHDPWMGVQQPQEARREAMGPRAFFVFGKPMHPSKAPGVDNLTYAFRVMASSYEQAEALVAQILAGGIGAPLRPGVQLLLYSTMESSAAGGRYVQAQVGAWQEWSFDFNDGAYRANLHTHSVTYMVGDWSVVETVVPLSAFQFSTLPGAQMTNRGRISYRSAGMQDTATGEFTYRTQND